MSVDWPARARDILGLRADWPSLSAVPPTGGALNLLDVEGLRSTGVDFRGSLSTGVTSPSLGAAEATRLN